MKSTSKWVAIAALFWTTQALAIPFPSPFPGLGPDIDGDGYFSQDTGLKLGLEILDLASFEFGFYFEGAPGSPYTIFDSADINPDPGGPGSVDQVALISFVDGLVIDIDEGVLQTAFPVASADIGYYLSIAGFTVFSDALLNGGSDVFGAFPLLDPGSPPGSLAQVFFDVGAAPIYISATLEVGEPVSEPSILLLFGSGLLLVGFVRRRLSAA